MTAIIESKDVDSIHIDELVGSLQSYELDLPKTNKSKSMALKSVDGNGFDDELSSTEIAYLAKNFRNFLRNNNRGQEVETMLNLRILRKMNQPKSIMLINQKKKLDKFLIIL